MTNNPLPCPAAPLELLTVAEYAARLKVSRTTVFTWLKNGALTDGADYIRRGRVLRFSWPTFPTTQPPPRITTAADPWPTPPEAAPNRSHRPRGKRGETPAVNLDY